MIITMKVEIPTHSKIKYEVDKETGEVRVDRVSKLAYPATYGYIKETLADDGDALDVFLLGDYNLAPGCIVDVEIVAIIDMWDNKEADSKVIAILPGEIINNREVNNIINFLKIYKDDVVVGELHDNLVAVSYYNHCKKQYEE